MRAFLTTALAGVLACQAADLVFAQDHEVSQATRQLEQGKAEEKSAAARTLGDFGPAAATAVPALVQALQSSDASLKYESAIALGRIGANAKQLSLIHI